MASRVKEHFSNETNRYNKLPVRLIGNQAIALARYYYRLVDTLESEDEAEAQTIQRLALSKIGEYLRNAGGLFNRIETISAQVAELKEMCSMYFNLMSFFFHPVLMSQHGKLDMPFPVMQICCLQGMGWAMALSPCRLKRPNILE